MELKSLDLEGIDGSPIGRRTYEAIADSIVTGQLQPGQTLSDRQLGEALGVSRTPVREALHMLVSSGLVERRGRVGWAVSGFGADDVVQVYQARRIVEPAGFERMDAWDPDLFEAFDRFSVMHDSPPGREDLAEYLQTDRDFHRLLVHSSGNALLQRFYDVLELQIDRIRHFVPGRNWLRIAESFEEHRAILDAVAERNADAARDAARRHICAAEEAILSLL